MAVCVVIHASGVTAALRWLRHPRGATILALDRAVHSPGRLDIFLHLVEITVWALFYVWTGAMPDLQSALYFSAVTYTTTGYGDLVLPTEWRLVGGVEALTGILMCGWSTGFFFAVVSRMFRAQLQPEDTP